jgi:hypothetical protein
MRTNWSKVGMAGKLARRRWLLRSWRGDSRLAWWGQDWPVAGSEAMRMGWGIARIDEGDDAGGRGENGLVGKGDILERCEGK